MIMHFCCTDYCRQSNRILPIWSRCGGDRIPGYILVLENDLVWAQQGTRYIDFLVI